MASISIPLAYKSHSLSRSSSYRPHFTTPQLHSPIKIKCSASKEGSDNEENSCQFKQLRNVACGFLVVLAVVNYVSPVIAAGRRLPPLSTDPDRAFVGITIGQDNGVYDKPLDLRFCDYTNEKNNLKGKSLTTALMSGENFDGADMTEVIMSKAYAVGASFKGRKSEEGRQIGTLGKAIYIVGFWIRETGQAKDRLGCRLQGNYYFHEYLSRHRTLMNWFDKVSMVAKDAFVAPSASLIGDVHVGRNASIWYGCVLRGDVNNISIGAGTNIQDNSLVHVAKLNLSGKVLPTIIGNNVTIGHSAILHGCTVEDEAFVGMGATLLDGAVVEKMLWSMFVPLSGRIRGFLVESNRSLICDLSFG